MRMTSLMIGLAAASLAACQPPTTPDTGTEPAAPATPSATRPTSGAIPKVTGPAAPEGLLEPQVMQLAEWRSAELQGELGCGFSRVVADGPLLFTASDVDPDATSDAAIKLDGKVVKLRTESKGGFNALSAGARFVGPDGLAANVVRSGERVRETPQIAEESPRYPALLVISQRGREMQIDGFWECGP